MKAHPDALRTRCSLSCHLTASPSPHNPHPHVPTSPPSPASGGGHPLSDSTHERGRIGRFAVELGAAEVEPRVLHLEPLLHQPLLLRLCARAASSSACPANAQGQLGPCGASAAGRAARRLPASRSSPPSSRALLSRVRQVRGLPLMPMETSEVLMATPARRRHTREARRRTRSPPPGSGPTRTPRGLRA